MAWTKEPALDVDKIHHGCLNCSNVGHTMPLDAIIAVGFGSADVTKDGEYIYSEEHGKEDYRALSEFEDMAKTDPDHDWRVTMFGPLHGETYQRHGDNEWVLIESNEGFA